MGATLLFPLDFEVAANENKTMDIQTFSNMSFFTFS